MENAGQDTLMKLIGSQPDVDFVLASLRPGKLPPSSVRTLGALIWGVLPTAEWLGSYGWRNPGRCVVCEGADATAHVLFGCAAVRPDAHRIARDEWRRALAAGKRPEPKVAALPSHYVISEFVNGVAVPPGPVKFLAGRPTHPDGSADFMGTRFANAAAAVVQLGEDGRSFSGGVLCGAAGAPPVRAIG